jgi:predicted ATPase
MKVIIERVRSFRKRHEFPIKPITLIVGENSSGKTTLLACAATALSPDFPNLLTLNNPPFAFGAFNTIASRGASPSSFVLGVERHAGKRPPTTTHATFSRTEGGARLSSISIECESFCLEASITAQGKVTGELRIRQSRGRPFKIEASIPPTAAHRSPGFLNVDLLYWYAWQRLTEHRNRTERHTAVISQIQSLMGSRNQIPQIRPLAPLRSTPRRTYDLTSELFDPAGEHVPIVLSRRLMPDQRGAHDLTKALREFGRTSGLFESVEVRRFGKDEAGPFQVEVRVSNEDFNLVDVGYGVSQALPIAVDSLTAPKQTQFLIQQPEVHLHPSAQAGLASLLLSLWKRDGKRFIIETHSDYIVDRIRAHIKRGELDPSDVSLIFLERSGLETAGYVLGLNSDGSVSNPPPSYRDFFIREQLALIS